MTTQASTGTYQQQTTQTDQQAQDQPDGKALLEKFLAENPAAKPHVVALGKGLFEEDASRMKSSIGKLASERDTYRKATKLTAEQVEALTELSALQEETIADLVEKGAPEDLLREYAELGKKPSEIKAYAKKLQSAAPAKGGEDLTARLDRLEALLTGQTKANAQNVSQRLPLSPVGGGGVVTQKSIQDLADGEWDPKAAQDMLRRLGVR